MEELEQTVQRGKEARQILVSPVFVDAQQTLKDKYLKELLGSKTPAEREELFFKIKVLGDVITEIGIVEQRGVKAEHDIKTRKRRATQ